MHRKKSPEIPAAFFVPQSSRSAQASGGGKMFLPVPLQGLHVTHSVTPGQPPTPPHMGHSSSGPSCSCMCLALPVDRRNVARGQVAALPATTTRKSGFAWWCVCQVRHAGVSCERASETTRAERGRGPGAASDQMHQPPALMRAGCSIGRTQKCMHDSLHACMQACK